MKNKLLNKHYRKLYITIVIFILIPVFLAKSIIPFFEMYTDYKIIYQQEQAAQTTISRLRETLYGSLNSDDSDNAIRYDINTYEYKNYWSGSFYESNPLVFLLNNIITPADIITISKYRKVLPSNNYVAYSYSNISNATHGVAQLSDESGNVIATNKYSFMADIIFADEIPEEYCGYYFCENNPDIPGLSELFKSYETVSKYPNNIVWEGFTLKNAYINFENRTFIPHEGEIRYYNHEEMPKNALYGSAIEKTYPEYIRRIPINITTDMPGYELIDLEATTRSYPYCKIRETCGEKQEIIDQAQKYKYRYEDEDFETNVSSERNEDDGNFVSYSYTHIPAKNKTYTLSLKCFTDLEAPEIKAFKSLYIRKLLMTVVFFEILILFIMFIRIRSRVRFETYQRDLTNHLAHDIKTPLMAIGGYTENLLEGDMTEEEQKRYLDSILSNISFTDSIINRTLYLNQTEKIRVRKETTDLRALIESAFEKYRLMLEEKQITFEVTGEATIKTKRDQIEMLIENLISNAVKYTPEQGNISVLVTPKSITVKNSVSEKLRTRKLKQPFVRGDKARSNVKGTGLGLSIADRAAAATGFRLKLSCSGSEFKATARKKILTLK